MSISVHLGSLYCKLKRMISCTLWSTCQSSNTSYFGHFIRALPSDSYSIIMLWFTIALSRKYQHCFSLNSVLNLTQVNCYCWQSAGCVVKASWQHDNSFSHELVWCRNIQAKDWRHRHPDCFFHWKSSLQNIAQMCQGKPELPCQCRTPGSTAFTAPKHMLPFKKFLNYF